jgi:peptidoglycan/xylan/chitin deacetylase (PgdA/CDA1 family)
MPECDDSALLYEVEESRMVLQKRIGKAIESFCYPNGNADSRTTRAVEQAGYKRAVTTVWGGNGKEAEQYQLRRYDMVAKRVQGASGKFMPELLALRMSAYFSAAERK